MSGIIFDIQRYSITDGPGIRTTVFFKGCPLRCRWCENPESLHPEPQLAFHRKKCIGCKACVRSCPHNAIHQTAESRIDWSACDNCGECTQVCMAEALEIIGKKMTVEDIMHEIRQDDVFYRQSNGGVTLSGGEATLQYDFLLELLRALKCEGYHVVLETSGQVAGERLEMLANLVDIFYFDIKGLHPGLHKLHTGIDNTVIWANIRLLTAAGKRIVFRIPVIPGYTDDADQVRLLDAFISGLGTRPEPVEIQLLPFHAFGEDKLETIHTTQKKLGLLPGSAGRLDEIQSLLQKPGRTVVIGGR